MSGNEVRMFSLPGDNLASLLTWLVVDDQQAFRENAPIDDSGFVTA